ncbi:MAG: CPBP family intramembrane glutamic endopeptidase [Planctomycetota bacterium]
MQNSEDDELEDGVYTNGLRHPSRRMRARIAAELAGLAVATIAFLTFAPRAFLNNWTFVGLALVGLGLIMYRRNEIQERIWGPPESPDFDRVRRCTLNMSALTIPPMIIFLALGLFARYVRPDMFNMMNLDREPCPMISLHFFLALAFYVPWALLQQTLFQFYLLGRLRALLPFASPLLLATINGCCYGLVHLPSGYLLTLVTIIGGICWSYSYHRDRYVFPLAVSHALLATTFFYWVYGKDIVVSMIEPFWK